MTRCLQTTGQGYFEEVTYELPPLTENEICVQAVIESTEGIRMHGTALIKIDFSILWGCVRHATYPTITRYQFHKLKFS
jgi:hypothetical protein